MAVTKSRLSIVGCGPGAKEFVSPIVRETIDQAEVLFGAPHLLALFPDSQSERIPVTGKISEMIDAIAARRHRNIVVAVSGDPGISSLAQSVVQHVGRSECHVLPGISSVQVAFSRIALDWADARILSIHGSNKSNVVQGDLTYVNKIAVLTGGRDSGPFLTELLQQLQQTKGEWILFACENLTLQDERVVCIDAAELASYPQCSRTIILFIQKGLLA